LHPSVSSTSTPTPLQLPPYLCWGSRNTEFFQQAARTLGRRRVSTLVSVGARLGRYEIRSQIGAGGMGEVYLAQDTKLDRKVALKILPADLAANQDRMRRFVQEAKAAAALNHPNIAHIYEIGESDGTNCIAMEFVDGKTLEKIHREKGELKVLLKHLLRVAEGLAKAHASGIVHRDLKPDTGPDDATRPQINTKPGIVMGTVVYMSPEQARGNLIDPRSDIWSFGVVLYEMIARKIPFRGETSNHTIVAILEQEPPQLGNVPSELQRIIRKALTKDVEMRYQSARDLLIDLKNLHRDLDIQGELKRSVVPNVAAQTGPLQEQETQVNPPNSIGATRSDQAVSTQTASSLEYALTQAKRHKLVTAILGIVVLSGIAIAAYFAFVSRSGSGNQISSIAVMPFVNDSGNADVEYLSDGMTETLISSLSQLPNLNVKPRSSVFRYRGKETDPQTIGKDLNVQVILNGRVAQRGQDLSLFVELIDIDLDKVVWSQRSEPRFKAILKQLNLPE
jgi:serine/threonine protein kinase